MLMDLNIREHICVFYVCFPPSGLGNLVIGEINREIYGEIKNEVWDEK